MSTVPALGRPALAEATKSFNRRVLSYTPAKNNNLASGYRTRRRYAH